MYRLNSYLFPISYFPRPNSSGECQYFSLHILSVLRLFQIISLCKTAVFYYLCVSMLQGVFSDEENEEDDEDDERSKSSEKYQEKFTGFTVSNKHG